MTEQELIGLALALGAKRLGPWSRKERALASSAIRPQRSLVERCIEAIHAGEDPLGEAFSALRSPAERRALGATYTPRPIVEAMLDWAALRTPERVVDAGAGSGRFLVAAGRRFSRAKLVASEIDPVAALLLRGHLASAGMAARSFVVVGDYRELALPYMAGPTAFLGNPPYVRHHLISIEHKQWLVDRARAFGMKVSRLAGLYAHFFLATALHARPGDYGALITAAEWLDVNYGSFVRQLFLERLGGVSVDVLKPEVLAFADAQTTASVSCFEVGRTPVTIRMQSVAAVDELSRIAHGPAIPRQRLAVTARWTALMRPARQALSGYVELGELCRVHRGQVTGANRVWITGSHSLGLPVSVLFPSVTKARELFSAGRALSDASVLRRVIDLPVDLDRLTRRERQAVDRFLVLARDMGASETFVATHRKAWWSVGLREPAPIIATYMARRPPVFVRNLVRARHINIAHGLYPREPLSDDVLDALAQHLSSATALCDGRTYAGGLTKFEPREMERLLVPTPELLRG